jgi:predicted nucleic acid-binding protein
MIALDAGVLSLLIYSKSSVPKDFRTGNEIEHAKERIDGLVRDTERDDDSIVIPTPALSEALVVVAPNVQRHVEELESQSCFKVRPFGTRAAIEVALRVKQSKDTGDKKEGFERQWDKIKYDRQIVAIAKVEGVSTIYSLDEDIHKHGKLWGIAVRSVSDLPLPQKQAELFEKSEPPTPPSAPENVPQGAAASAPKSESVANESASPARGKEENQLETNPSHPPAVQGSDSGRSEGEAAGDGTKKTQT